MTNSEIFTESLLFTYDVSTVTMNLSEITGMLAAVNTIYLSVHPAIHIKTVNFI